MASCSLSWDACTIGMHLGLEEQCHRLDYVQKLKM